MSSPAEGIRDHLINATAFGDPESSSFTWPLYISFLPESGYDDAAAIYDTIGWKDGRQMDGLNVNHPGIQLKVRSRDYMGGWDRLKVACEILEGITSITVAGLTIVNVSQQGPQLFLGLEEGTKRRNLFTANFLVSLEA